MGKHFRGCTGVKQRVDINLADVSWLDVAVGGAVEAGEISVISGFGRKSRRRRDAHGSG